MRILNLYSMFIAPDPFGRRVKVLLRHEKDRRQQWCGVQLEDGSITFEAVPEGCPPSDHTFDITEQDAQAAFDQLWNAGYRPRGGRDSEGVREAQREHIKDLRGVIEKPTSPLYTISHPTPQQATELKNAVDLMYNPVRAKS